MTSDMLDFKGLVARVADGQSLSVQEAKSAFDIMMSGDATPSQMGGLLMALRVRGETVAEITGAVMTMREKMTRIVAPANAIDIVGTGGDGTGTLNISTASAIVTAACGLPVAKHGNRAASSLTGAADVLSTLGVNLDAHMNHVQAAIDEAGLAFMMAQRHHGAMRNVGPTRVELGTRTIFNLLGPMSNPAGVKRQLIGCFAKDWLRPMAETLKNLGSERVWVVHGGDGSDELTTTGISYVAALEDDAIREFEIHPEEAGLPVAQLADLKGGAPDMNAAAITALLDGTAGAFRDVACYNTAVALKIAGQGDDLSANVARAQTAIDSGEAKQALAKLVEISNRPEPVASA